MKRLIRFLARISGAEKDIRFEERHNCARKIVGASYWFSNHSKYGVMYPFMLWLGRSIGNQNSVTGDARNVYDELNNSEVLEDGGWKDLFFNSTIGKLEIKDKQQR